MKGVEALMWNMFEYNGSAGLYLAYRAMLNGRDRRDGKRDSDLDLAAAPVEEDERRR